MSEPSEPSSASSRRRRRRPPPAPEQAANVAAEATGPSGRHPVVLLGPQRLRPTLVHAVRELGLDGPLAAITAGWQEREAEVDEMREHVGRKVLNLMLHERSDDVFARDPELWDAYRERQDRLKELQALYRVRLHAAKEAARQLLLHQGPSELLDPERAAAIDTLRAIDAHHRERLRGILDAWNARWCPAERPAVAKHRRQIVRLLAQSAGLLVAGGHVAVLLNRIRLFALEPLLGNRPLIAWSAGAMVLGEQVVVFHDSPPQGSHAVAEVLELGLRAYRGVIPLPHARRRLELGDAARVALFARRFAPDLCLALDEETGVWLLPGQAPRGIGITRRLTTDGTLVELDRGGEVAA